MAFFSRLIKRLGVFGKSRAGGLARTRVMRFEPLEDRRLLTAASDNFTVVRIDDTKVGLHWTPRPEQEVTGYEVEVSINGIDNWRPFFGHEPIVQSDIQDLQAACDLEPNEPCYFNQRDVYRSYYYRIQSLPAESTPIWSLVNGSNARPKNTPEDNTVKVSAIAHSQIDVPLIAATIELRWPEELAYRDADYTISRKEKDELSFTQVASLTWDGQNTITGWTDENLGSKTAYEYKVQRHRKEDDSVPPNFYFTSANTATGYVYAGVDVPLEDDDSTIESPGTVMLVIDITLTGMVPDEIDRLEDDMRAEGWDVLKIYVSPHDDLNPQSAENLANIEFKRNEIIEAYEDPNIDLTAVLLLGHVPIPMSGNSSPDGHQPRRPMPADVYYGDVDASWKFGANADGASSVFSIDMDGDGDVDVLSASKFDDAIAWYENDGGGSFTKRIITTDADDARSVFAIDLDGDGDIDVLSASYRDDKIAWYENDGNENFTPHNVNTPDPDDNATNATNGDIDGPTSVFAINLDGDTDIDIVVASARDDTIAWYENDGNQNFTRHVINNPDPDGFGSLFPLQGDADGASAVYAIDVDGIDGIDIIAASKNDDTIAWYRNDGNQNFERIVITEDPDITMNPYMNGPLQGEADGASSVFAINVDGMNGIDIVVTSTNDDTVAWYENDGSQGFTWRVVTRDPDITMNPYVNGPLQGEANGASSVYAINVDGGMDTDVDFVVASANNDRIAWYENDGSEGFTAHEIATDADGASSVFAIDVNGDGDVDVLVASQSDDSIDWYENDGSQGFTQHPVSEIMMENNVPDDGEDDRPVELMVGRVDMRGLTFFSDYDPALTEAALLKRYLDKDHAFRTGEITVERKGRIRDYHAGTTSSGAWQTLSGLFGPAENPTQDDPDNINVWKWEDTDWSGNMPEESFLWGHGSSDAGDPTHFMNYRIVSTETLAVPDEAPVTDPDLSWLEGVDNSTVFNSFLGSWLMEWQQPNSMLRAILADEGYGLASTWAGGATSWGNTFYEHMSLGDTIGHGLLNTQNHKAYNNSEWTGVYVSLIGDPTLRMFMVQPPGEVVATVHSGNAIVDVSWTPSPDPDVTGYRIYRRSAASEPFECVQDINLQCVTTSATATGYTDDTGTGNDTYIVRAVKIETTGGGTFVNLSAGVYHQDPYADLNGDGTVDGVDEDILMSNYGNTNPFPTAAEGNLVDPSTTSIDYEDWYLLDANRTDLGDGNAHVTAVTPVEGTTVFSTAIDIYVTFNEPVSVVGPSALRLYGLGAAEATVGTPVDEGNDIWRFPISGLRAGPVAVALGLVAGSIQDADLNNAAPVVWPFDAEVGLVLNEGGTDEVALIPNFLGFSSDFVTVEVTFASQTMPSGGVPLFAYATDAYADAFTLFVDTTSPFNMTLYVNGVGKVLHSGQDVLDLFDGVKRHLAVTFDSLTGPNATAVAYIDGEVFGTSQTFADDVGVDKGLDDLGGTFFLGQEPDVEDPDDYLFDVNQIFKGSILEVRVYDEVRDATEIVDDMDDPLDLAALPTTLVDAWEFRGAGGIVSGLDMLGGKHFEMSNQGVGLILNDGEEVTQDSALVTDFEGFSSNLLTVEFTFASDGITSVSITPLISYATDQQVSAFVLYVQQSGSKLRFWVNGSSTLTLFEGPIVAGLFDGAPHHIALTYNANTSEAQVFLDGTPKTVRDVPGNPGPAVAGGVFALGQDPDNLIEDDFGFDETQIFSTEISDVRIYDEVRSAAQIQLDMITPLDPAALPASLAHAWQMRVGPDLTSGADLVGGKHLTVSTNSYGVRFPSDGDYAKASAYDGFSSPQVTFEMTFSHDPLSAGAVVPLLSYGKTTNADAFTLVA